MLCTVLFHKYYTQVKPKAHKMTSYVISWLFWFFKILNKYNRLKFKSHLRRGDYLKGWAKQDGLSQGGSLGVLCTMCTVYIGGCLNIYVSGGHHDLKSGKLTLRNTSETSHRNWGAPMTFQMFRFFALCPCPSKRDRDKT